MAKQAQLGPSARRLVVMVIWVAILMQNMAKSIRTRYVKLDDDWRQDQKISECTCEAEKRMQRCPSILDIYQKCNSCKFLTEDPLTMPLQQHLTVCCQGTSDVYMNAHDLLQYINGSRIRAFTSLGCDFVHPNITLSNEMQEFVQLQDFRVIDVRDMPRNKQTFGPLLAQMNVRDNYTDIWVRKNYPSKNAGDLESELKADTRIFAGAKRNDAIVKGFTILDGAGENQDGGKLLSFMYLGKAGNKMRKKTKTSVSFHSSFVFVSNGGK